MSELLDKFYDSLRSPPQHLCERCGTREILPSTLHPDPRWCKNRLGEEFCSPSHRKAHNEERRKLLIEWREQKREEKVLNSLRNDN